MSGDSAFALGMFSHGDERPFLCVVEGDTAIAAGAVAGSFAGKSLFDLLQDWPASFAALKQALGARKPARTMAIENLRAHAPLPEARQVFCAGANYRKHVMEMIIAVERPETAGMSDAQKQSFAESYVAAQAGQGHPYVFMKTVTSIAGPDDDLVLPAFSKELDWEIELAVVMGQKTFQSTRAAAPDAIAGYMLVNDLTARDKVRRTDPGAIGADWLAAKGGRGFLPSGPLFVPAAFVADPQNLRMRLSVNGVLMQDESTADMTFDIARQIEHISAHAEMLAGDILCTGSPAGNGIARGVFLKPGDVMEAEIEGLGRQRVRCIAPD